MTSLFLRALRFYAFNLLIALSPLLLAFAIAPYSLPLAKLLGNLWMVAWIVGMTMKRPPCYYGGYAAWWRDRANWWVKMPHE
jgi:hypothetical protein